MFKKMVEFASYPVQGKLTARIMLWVIAAIAAYSATRIYYFGMGVFGAICFGYFFRISARVYCDQIYAVNQTWSIFQILAWCLLP